MINILPQSTQQLLKLSAYRRKYSNHENNKSKLYGERCFISFTVDMQNVSFPLIAYTVLCNWTTNTIHMKNTPANKTDLKTYGYAYYHKEGTPEPEFVRVRK